MPRSSLLRYVAVCVMGTGFLLASETTVVSTPFSAGQNGCHSYRIPALAMARDGTLLAFAEGRRDTWKDKSRTCIVLRRSQDKGKTWQPMQILAQNDTFAYMDPSPVVDIKTGNIYLFLVRWPRSAKTAENNAAILLTSRDNGITWQEQDVTALIPDQNQIAGFGPGSGIQLMRGPARGRLIMPSRQRLADGSFRDIMIYSDTHGKTWATGKTAPAGGEGVAAEGPKGAVYLNLRRPKGRVSTISSDGGINWSPLKQEPSLRAPEKGCHASVLGLPGGVLLYCGPTGSTPSPQIDNRGNLALYTSYDMGQTWGQSKQLSNKASGYSSMTRLPDGTVAILYEAGDETGFIRSAKRPAGWMRLDFITTAPPKRLRSAP